MAVSERLFLRGEENDRQTVEAAVRREPDHGVLNFNPRIGTQPQGDSIAQGVPVPCFRGRKHFHDVDPHGLPADIERSPNPFSNVLKDGRRRRGRKRISPVLVDEFAAALHWLRRRAGTRFRRRPGEADRHYLPEGAPYTVIVMLDDVAFGASRTFEAPMARVLDV